ncbi:isoleucyl-tRNA synthetase [Strigomonas culicis]|nr:isoleucyl-tRNA synthetase [Strigomonas culicis]|eukprot:EPY29084.1 isoleucyl-tRNA synthetase [Strigomonas culicis]
MFRCSRLHIFRNISLFAHTATLLKKNSATKTPSFFTTASRTVIYDRTNDTNDRPRMKSVITGPLKNFEELNFPKMEEEVLTMWKEKDAFKTSVKLSEGRKPYTFYDGPPFATGLPHYGHILAGTIKDIVTRFAHQTGHHVVRRFGWDCHGLPIEFEIDKELGIKTSHDVLEYGIGNYNDKCQQIVMRYANEWRKTVERTGRWIDFDNDYKSMELYYMETVWWVFSQLYAKNYVYRGFKVMPYSTGCTTPLSNFEANLNYKDVTDPSLTIAFQSRDDANVYFLAWTTTPWTLPSNLGLCVNKDVDYVKVLDAKTQRHYYLAECRLSEVYPPKKKDKKKDGAAPAEEPYIIEEHLKGGDLVGRKYVPLFPYFAEECKETAFRILSDNYVSTETGTGIVHQAPAFGVDDYRVCLEHGIIKKGGTLICPVEENGFFTADVTDFAGRYVKDADADIIKMLEANGNLVHKGSIVHSYPFCWRSETPLLYKAVDAWFVNVESINDRLLAANDKTYWVPEFVKTRRFSNWLADACDWNVSRNRYWGTPLPIWHSEDWEEVVVISSVAQLEELSGVKGITNIHRQYVDDITIPSKREGHPPLRRASEVFDCWFESGSMPYAQVHYPFENKESFPQRFPADYIAEGLDQTRGWFYTLLVLGVALFDQAPFRNVGVTGLILAEDGKKMSKRLKNYPEPGLIIDRYGADALRMYIINSPVVRGEPLRFREDGVKSVVKEVLLPLFNAAKFFIDNTNLCVGNGGTVSLNVHSTNEMDRWILASTQTLLSYVRKEMGEYHLYNVVPGIIRFVVDLSNWYIRMNRRRMKSTVDIEDRSFALSTTLTVFFDVSRIIGHIAPFIAEMIYQAIKPLLPAEFQEDSVHYLMIPEENAALIDADLERAMSRMINIVELVRVLRDRMVVPIKRPVREVIIVHPDPTYLRDVEKVVEYIKDEVNTFNVTLSDGHEYVTTYLDVNFEVLGKLLRKELPAIRKAVQAFTPEEVADFIHNKGREVCGHKLTMEHVKVLRKFKDGIVDYESHTDNDVVVLVDKREDQSLIDSWRAREFVSRVQQLRKKAKLVVTEALDVYFESEDEELTASLKNCADQINKTIRGKWDTLDQKPADAKLIAEEDNTISGIPIHIVFTAPTH